MCLLIKPGVVFGNAFLAKQMPPFLEMGVLRKFCNILSDKLEKGGYKYALFQVSEKDIEEFCDRDDTFIKGIGKIVRTKELEESAVRKINSIYDPDVQAILREARDAFTAA